MASLIWIGGVSGQPVKWVPVETGGFDGVSFFSFGYYEAFSTLKIRLGGSLQDKVVYQTEDNPKPCIQFKSNKSEMFGFTEGCLPLSRWDQLSTFFKDTWAEIIFGLNALAGKTIQADGSAVGPWDPANAESFICYTVKRNYAMYAWELWNEQSGSGVGIRVTASQYASDTIALKNVVHKSYQGIRSKPRIIAPGGFFDANWFKEFIDKTPETLDIINHSPYIQSRPGVDQHLVEKILDPSYLDREADTFKQLENILKTSITGCSQASSSSNQEKRGCRWCSREDVKTNWWTEADY
ncbi:putative glycosidase [Helianthus debilis subsp. tardiflorus]